MIVHLTPGDPASVMLGEEATAEQIAELREQLGLNLPIYEQYVHWIGGVFKGDLGTSILYERTCNTSDFRTFKADSIPCNFGSNSGSSYCHSSWNYCGNASWNND